MGNRKNNRLELLGKVSLSSSLWDHYSAELTGYMILQDNGYLIMSSERY